MSIDSRYHLKYLLLCALGCFLLSCEEEYLQKPPFSQVQDTIFHDVDNWFYFNPSPVLEGGIAYFPFSYHIFEVRFEGFLLSTDQRIYLVDREKNLARKQVFLDFESESGDTLFRYSKFQYNLLIKRETLPESDEVLYFVLRRSRTGVKRLRERTLWLISEKRGILAAAEFDIGFSDGQIEMDMIGDSRYFRDPTLLKTLKYYDHDATWLVDQDRRIIYEFDKHTGILKSRDFNKREDLFEYQFDRSRTRNLIEFRILQNNRDQTILLQAGDSCYYFSESLQLQRSGICQ
jgi:hypothetical protein